MAHGALGAAHLAAAQVGLRAAGREGPGRWAKPTHRLPLMGNARILFDIRCSSCLVLPVDFLLKLRTELEPFPPVLEMRKWKDRPHGYLFSWYTPTSPSLPPCPRGVLDFGAGCFSVSSGSSAHHRRDSRKIRAWGVCLPTAR